MGCFGGGGGSSQAQDEALAEQNRLLQEQIDNQRLAFEQQISAREGEEAARAGRISSSIGAVNSAFGNVGQQAGQLENATFALNQDQLEEGRDAASRDLRFALARAGLSGGSVDVDKGEELVDRFNTGLTGARSHASNVADSFLGQQEGLRSQLLGVASTGGVGPGFFSGALSGNRPPAPSIAPGLGDVFSGLANTIGNAAILWGLRGSQAPFGQDQFQSFNPASSKRNTGTVVNFGSQQ